MTKILVIEDDKLLTKVYKNYLESEGYQVEIADDGKKGLEKILSDGWDLILLDIMLPEKSGLEILKELTKKTAKGKNGPIVALSNVFDQKIIRQVMKLGAVGYILKDKIDPKGVINEVKNYLEQKELY